MPRAVLVLHRWLGIGVGLLMTIWCLSGFVMLYVDYPRLSPQEQLAGLEALPPPARDGGWRLPDLPGDMLLRDVRVEAIDGRPVLRLRPDHGAPRPIPQMRALPAMYDLGTGEGRSSVAPVELAAIAAAFGRASGVSGPVISLAETGMDQWTVQTYARNAPLYRVDYGDAAGTRAYISGRTGEVVQNATRFERFWGWLGAVPHWLYPTLLRENGTLWTQLVIWSSLAGCFLTATGLWIGITRLRRQRDGRLGSPYRGLWWWHHMIGLLAGFVTLTWVFSGLLTMNPWGMLEGGSEMSVRARIAGPVRWEEVAGGLRNVDALPVNTIRIEAAPLGGRLFLLARQRDGGLVRLDEGGAPAPLTRSTIIDALGGPSAVAALDLLRREDDYYYTRREPVELPVWKARLRDAARTTVYIDHRGGQPVRIVDDSGRTRRWLVGGLHSLDLPYLAGTMMRYLVALPLLALVTLVCATGTWMGVSHVRRDLRRRRNRRRRERAERDALSGARQSCGAG